MKLKTLYAALLCSVSICAFAGLPFTLSPVSTQREVTDTNTGLIWRYCPEGMTGNGNDCAGVASTYTHEAALARATALASTTGLPWRLPNVKELTSIARTGRSVNPSIDVVAFPRTPSSLFWSSTATAPAPFNSASGAWHVDFSNGEVSNNTRSYQYHVRLVRTP